MKQFAEETGRLCRRYRECRGKVEQWEECARIRQVVERLWGKVRGKLDIAEPGVLLAVMDAYEVTRNEKMLQEVLDVVSGNLKYLEISANGVKLLAYCYYYVEEEECLVKAGEMLEELKRRGEDVAEMEKILQNL